jgi:hypothetical protein
LLSPPPWVAMRERLNAPIDPLGAPDRPDDPRRARQRRELREGLADAAPGRVHEHDLARPDARDVLEQQRRRGR